MAGDWIKMRVWIARDPRVIAIADALAHERRFMDWLADPVHEACRESAYEHVTRPVIVAVTVTGLLQVWGVTREQGAVDGDDVIVPFARFETLDEIAGVPWFGEAMASVGWAEETADGGVRFPKFLKTNASPDEMRRQQDALRKRRQRERRSRDSHAGRSRDSHAQSREEESREEENSSTSSEDPTEPELSTSLELLFPNSPASRAVEVAKAPRVTWITPYADAWRERTDGEMAIDPALKPLSKLRARHGDSAVLAAWLRYLAETDVRYLGANNFASKYGRWAGSVTPPRSEVSAQVREIMAKGGIRR
jgi:hypothetical protein